MKVQIETVKGLFTAFLATLALFCFPLEVWGSSLDGEIAVQQRARDELDKKIKQYNEMADQKARQAQSLQGRLTNLRQDFRMAQQQLRILELQSSRLQRSVVELNLNLEEAAFKVSVLVRELRGRLLNMYKYGPREEMHLLISAENTHDAVTSAYLLGRLARSDQAAVEELLSQVSGLDRTRRELEKSSARLAEQSQEINSQRERYGAVIGETSALLSDVQRERRRAEQAAKNMEQAQQEIGRTITALLRQKRDRAPAPIETGAATPALPASTYGPLEWPVQGAIASPYGVSVHPEFKTKTFNSGVDISAASGTAVRAAGPGEVLYEGWLDDFGQVIIISHGRNLSTVYAHLASAKVKERDTVQAGTIIGTVGNTGAGYGLHFEVREGANAKNPLNYLRKT